MKIRFHDMGVGLMMVDFEQPNDKLMAVKDNPWNFDKALIQMKDFDGEKQLKIIHLKDVVS